MPRVALRAYASLNDFLAAPLRQRASAHDVERRTSVKDFLERTGIPHVEIDLLLVNDEPSGFDRLLEDGDRVAAFPRLFALAPETGLRVGPPLPDPIRFVLDVHLGRLARYLRLAGLDAQYAASASDDELASISSRDTRVLLTRDVGLLKRRIVVYGYFVRATEPHAQFVEVLRRFAPVPIDPFSRCLRCGGALQRVSKAAILDRLPPRTREHYDEFRQCVECGTVFWKGAHYHRLARTLDRAVAEAEVGN